MCFVTETAIPKGFCSRIIFGDVMTKKPHVNKLTRVLYRKLCCHVNPIWNYSYIIRCNGRNGEEYHTWRQIIHIVASVHTPSLKNANTRRENREKWYFIEEKNIYYEIRQVWNDNVSQTGIYHGNVSDKIVWAWITYVHVGNWLVLLQNTCNFAR